MPTKRSHPFVLAQRVQCLLEPEMLPRDPFVRAAWRGVCFRMLRLLKALDEAGVSGAD